MNNSNGSPIPPPGPLAYEGISAIPFIVRTFPTTGPLPSYTNFNVPTIWVNPSTKQAWLLVSISDGGTPYESWILLGTANPPHVSTGPVEYITTSTDSAKVYPTSTVPGAGNVNFKADPGITITGATSNTVTFGLTGGGAAIDSIITPTGGPVTPDGSGNVIFANGTGINISGSGSTVTFNVSGGGVAWNYVTDTVPANPIDMVASNGYICNGSAQVTLKLPTSACLRGSIIEVVTYNANAFGWTITQSVGQKIQYGDVATTSGAGGSLTSISVLGGDSVKLLCTDDNTNFVALSSIGDITVT